MPSDKEKWFKAIAIIAVVLISIGVLAALTPWLMAQALLIGARDRLVAAGVPEALATGLMWLLGVPFALALLRVMRPFPGGKTWPKSRAMALSLLGVYVGVFYLALWKLGPTGDFYCPVDYRYFEKAGICPKHRLPLQKVTVQAIVTAARLGKKGPQRIEGLGPDGPFRDITTNAVLVFFGHDHTGRLVPYDGPGFDPVSGEELKLASMEIIPAWQQQCAEIEKQRASEEEARLATVKARRPGGGSVAGGGGSVRVSMEPPRRAASPWDGLSIGQLINEAAMDPDNARLHFYIGQRYLEDGDRAGALRSFREALRAAPDFAEARQAIDRLGGQP